MADFLRRYWWLVLVILAVIVRLAFALAGRRRP